MSREDPFMILLDPGVPGAGRAPGLAPPGPRPQGPSTNAAAYQPRLTWRGQRNSWTHASEGFIRAFYFAGRRATMLSPVRADRVFHYLLRPGTSAVPDILEKGLLPLDVVDPARLEQINRSRPDVFRILFKEFASRVLPPSAFRHTGIFLTPIDFRLLPKHPLAGALRIGVPIEAIDGTQATVTWAGPWPRVSLPFGRSALERARGAWTPPLIREWYGKDPTMNFFQVPQVVTYQESVSVRPEWVERSPGRGPVRVGSRSPR